MNKYQKAEQHFVDRRIEMVRQKGRNEVIPVRLVDDIQEAATMADLLAVMSQNTLLRTLPRDELFTLLQNSNVIDVDAEHELTKQGTPVTYVLFIWKGRAKAVLNGRNHKETWAVVNILGPGSDIGLLSAIDYGPHSATVVSLEKLQVIAIPVEVMHLILERHPGWYRDIAIIALQRLRNMGIWIDNLL